MRKPCRGPSPLGIIAIAAGALILLSLLLPTGFWWAAIGIGLILLGLWIIVF